MPAHDRPWGCVHACAGRATFSEIRAYRVAFAMLAVLVEDFDALVLESRKHAAYAWS